MGKHPKHTKQQSPHKSEKANPPTAKHNPLTPNHPRLRQPPTTKDYKIFTWRQ
ncbi:hypothetical protein CCHOA_09995 [Corynebacterium choanae]|uniref:Uncharacterized protein n=1 Tax=Corynebacterium choanae TaxID=1862358 RepID=A0A3G6J9D5_9CORY|nr:hypothetical protein CCHOA_09995 [Corynebacterium choanae]